MNKKYNLKYFQENKTVIYESGWFQGAYDLDGHRIGITPCDRSPRYAFVRVDGVVVASRIAPDKAIRKALEYMNENF